MHPEQQKGNSLDKICIRSFEQHRLHKKVDKACTTKACGPFHWNWPHKMGHLWRKIWYQRTST